MEKKKISFDKMTIILLIVGICVTGYFFVIGPYINRGEGDPVFIFTEVPFSETLNSSVIHLQDKDIMNVRGLDVVLSNGKISSIYFRYSSTTPEISDQEFNTKYGSNPTNQSLRKYLEYDGKYYFARLRIS